MRAKGEQGCDPGSRAGFDSLREVPDRLARAGLGFRDDRCILRFAGMTTAGTARNHAMSTAFAEAEAAGERGEVPVGAVVVGGDGRILAAAGNRTRELNDPTAHAEMLAIRAACAATHSERLPEADLYVTLEPCPMCAAAISFARIRRLYFGASDPKGGGVENGPRIFSQPSCHHAPEVYGGISEARSARLLQDFFARRR
jgi:tRNA(adenine34) deaminase